jgi:hypothetical protein
LSRVRRLENRAAGEDVKRAFAVVDHVRNDLRPARG